MPVFLPARERGLTHGILGRHDKFAREAESSCGGAVGFGSPIALVHSSRV